MANREDPSRDVSSIRARRSLAAARAAREGIVSMVEALRTSRPPKIPPNETSRRLPLGPVRIEQDPSLEAKVQKLESTNTKLSEACLLFKRQAGKYLIKKRLAEKGRVRLEEKVKLLWGEVGNRGRCYTTLLDEIDDIGVRLKSITEDNSEESVENVSQALQRLVERSKETASEMMEWTRREEENLGILIKSKKEAKPKNANGVQESSQRDEVKSAASVASTAVDEQTVADMVAFLESRLPKSHPAVHRARKAVLQTDPFVNDECENLRRERDALHKQLSKARLVIGKMMKERDLGRSTVGRSRWSDRKDTSGMSARGNDAARKVAEWRRRIEEHQKDPKVDTVPVHRAEEESVQMSPQLDPPEPQIRSRGGSVISMPVARLFKSPSVSSMGSDGLGKLTEPYKIDSSRKLFSKPKPSQGLSGLIDGLS